MTDQGSFAKGFTAGVGFALMLLFLFALVVGGIGESNTSEDTTLQDVDRTVDTEAGVVCYYPPETESGIDCLPLDETMLTPGG